jgi:hypothetical protein
MKRRTSEGSVVSILRDFGSQDPGDTATIDSMVTKAKEAINIHTKDKWLRDGINVATLLHSLIDVAIDDGGKHYVAYAILACPREEEPAEFLVQLADAWFTYLLYPGEYLSLHSNNSRLRKP